MAVSVLYRERSTRWNLAVFPFVSSAMLFPGWCQSVIFISCCRRKLMTFGLPEWVCAETRCVRARGAVARSWHRSEVDSLPSQGGISRMDCSSSKRRKLECGNKTLKRADQYELMILHHLGPAGSPTDEVSVSLLVLQSGSNVTSLAGFHCINLTDIQTV